MKDDKSVGCRQTEQFLESMGATYSLRDVPVREIDLRGSYGLQARLGCALDEDLIRQYGLLRKEGLKPPPLIMGRKSSGKYLVLDGNQRLAVASRHGDKVVQAYVVQSDDMLFLERIAWAANNRVNGKRNPPEVAMEHAVSLVARHGLTVREAAKECLLLERAVRDEVAYRKLRDELVGAGARALPEKSVLARVACLHALGNDLFVPAAEVLGAAGATKKEADELVRRVRRAPDQAARIAAVHEYAESEEMCARKADTRGGYVKRRVLLPRERLLVKLREIEALRTKYPDPATYVPSVSKECGQEAALIAGVCNFLLHEVSPLLTGGRKEAL